MAVPFSQTVRSLKADRGVAALLLVAIFSLMLAIWLVWAFTARFPVYAASATAPLLLDDTITATFSADAAKGLRNGQKALVYLDAPPLSEPVVLAATVIGVTGTSGGAQVEVAPDFRPLEAGTISSEILAAFSQPVSGHIEVEMEMLSPALLVLRSAGLNTDSAPLVSTR